MSEEGHFSPLVEGVKLLPNPLIFASYLLKLKNCWFSFPAYKSKEDLHFSAYKAFAPIGRLADCYHTQVDALGLGTLVPSARSMVTIIYIISFFPISLSRGLKSLFTEFSAIFC